MGSDCNSAKDKYGADSVLEQVYIRLFDAAGKSVNYRVIVDNAITSPNGSVKLIDTKASSTSCFTKNQRAGYPLIGQNDGVKERGSMKGTALPPTKISRIDPSNVGDL